MIPQLTLALLCTLLWVGSAPAATVIRPDDSQILYTGRWDDTDALRPWAQAQGSSIIANFEGTSVTATFEGVSQEYLRVIIDDDAINSTKVLLQPGTPMSLADGLIAGTHKVEIVKETDRGRATFVGFELDDGAELATPPVRPIHKIEFYGDSNLAGYSLESERNDGASDLVGSYYTYAGIVARMFNAEHVNHSKSGATTSSLLNAYDRTDWNSATPGWNFSDFPAELVVVNIGANDRGPQHGIRDRYHQLLDAMRAAHPSAHIVLFNAWGWDFREPANYIHEVIAEHGDPNMSARTFPWIFEQFHGCEYDHGGMAANLAAHIEKVLGWTSNAQDVMNGYGEGGDVANGGFEEVAPFGGWGWRYYDDAGVTRVNEAGAFEGEHHLRLSYGGATHQNIPASDGDTVTVWLWMRGAADGDRASITLDFRDQEAGGGSSTPIRTQTQTKTLTATWQQYSMSATAPSDDSRPVYHARVTLAAEQNSVVNLDSVRASVAGVR